MSLDRARLAAAVDRAEQISGLQMCVAVCRPDGDDPRAQAEAAFAQLGGVGRPAVLVLIVPETRRLEVVTGEGSRIDDAEAERAVSTMTATFAAGDLTTGIEEGLQVLAQAAGPDGPEGEELPDVIDA